LGFIWRSEYYCVSRARCTWITVIIHYNSVIEGIVLRVFYLLESWLLMSLGSSCFFLGLHCRNCRMQNLLDLFCPIWCQCCGSKWESRSSGYLNSPRSFTSTNCTNWCWSIWWWCYYILPQGICRGMLSFLILFPSKN
jgi:hypothetical protein